LLIFDGCDISQAMNHSILLLIHITIQIDEMIEEFQWYYHYGVGPILRILRNHQPWWRSALSECSCYLFFYLIH